MPNINPREVLAYLNELGYTNITAQQLKEFVRDLKKLIKYEERQKNKCKHDGDSNEINDAIFDRLYMDKTASSKAKEVQKKESVISVEVRRPKKCNVEFDQPHNVLSEVSEVPTSTSCTQTTSQYQILRPKSSSHSSQKSTKTQEKENLKPKVSFIRPRMQLKPSKSDPVALYHQYQAEWKKQKIPGEDSRADLRWAIREKMMSAPKVMSTATSVETLSKKRQNRL